MGHGQKILIVEDDPGLAEMLAHYFHVQGYEVITAASGHEAIIAAREGQPHLIVLDIHLPDFNGFEVCRQLQASHQTRTIPVIFLTELNDRVDRLQGLQLGVDDYITKPFDVQELRLRVRNTLHRASPQVARNPITQLPEGDPVQEALELAPPGSGVLIVELLGLNMFRELYGFVASDDVLRVMCLMIRNATMEIGGEGAFCGHIEEQSLLALCSADRLDALQGRIRQRADQALEYFYPSDNRGPNARTADRLRLEIRRVTNLGDSPVTAAEITRRAMPSELPAETTRRHTLNRASLLPQDE